VEATIVEVLMPRLSDSMEEGTIVAWLADHGDEVEAGREIVEIETDKATMTHEADTSGVLEILAEAGSILPLGAQIARIHSSGTNLPEREESSSGNGSTEMDPGEESSPLPRPDPSPTDPAGDVPPVARRVPASPLARRLAASFGLDLARITPSGPRGRIVKADVEAAAKGGGDAGITPAPADSATAQSSALETGTVKGQVEVVELTRLQQTVARRMSESKATAPDFTLEAEIDMNAATKLRRDFKDLGEGQVVPTYNDMVVKACALALGEHPQANGAYRDGRFELYSRINVGVAVAVDDGLIVPTISDVDRRSLTEIATIAKQLARRAREGQLTAADVGGGTFTVSNLGMYGISGFTAVLNPPQAGILAIGAIDERVVVGPDGDFVAQPTMSATLTADHRILYGATAALFLATVRERLERPLSLLVDPQPEESS
jgi:pyruvate dehydrogenase E2 component (dihydrolipoyllysine-residue acetyltransferase)